MAIRQFQQCAAMTLAASITGAVWASPASFVEEFSQSSLGSEWSVVSYPGPFPRARGEYTPANHYSLTDNAGFLRYSLDPWTYRYGFVHDYQRLYAGSFGPWDSGLELYRVFEGNSWTLEAKVRTHMPPPTLSGGATGADLDITVYFGNGGPTTFAARVMRYKDSYWGSDYLYAAFAQGSHNTLGYRDRDIPGHPIDTTTYIRITRKGTLVEVGYSSDGLVWETIARDFGPEIVGLPQRVTIVGAGDLPNGAYADWDYVTLTQANVPPIANAGQDQAATEGSLVTLDGTGTSSQEGTPAYSWAQVGGAPTVSLDTTDPARPTLMAPYVSSNTTLTFKLVVEDAYGADSDTVDITVVNVNNPPMADAGDDSTIKEGAVATLDGSYSYDSEGNPVFYSWSQLAGPPVELSATNAAKPTFTPSLGNNGTVVFKLQVCDGMECSELSQGTDSAAEDTVAIAIVENSVPVGNAGDDLTRDEGALATLDGSASYDPDGGDTLSYSWTQTAGDAVTLSDVNTATPSFAAPIVNLGGAAYEFELTVTDNDAINPKSATDSVTVHVRNINDPPGCHLAVADPSTLWPPNHKLVPVAIDGVADADSIYYNVTLAITGVTQDEPVSGNGDGDSSPDAIVQSGEGAEPVLLRTERAGGGNGRVYTVHFVAYDGFESCAGAVTVAVPHSRQKAAVDDGQIFDSAVP